MRDKLLVGNKLPLDDALSFFYLFGHSVHFSYHSILVIWIYANQNHLQTSTSKFQAVEIKTKPKIRFALYLQIDVKKRWSSRVDLPNLLNGIT